MNDRGFMISMNDGSEFYPEDPRPEDINIEDIACSLAQTNRFNGHANFPVSVAQHSLLVCSLVPHSLKLRALLHDAAEAYIGDIVTPMKMEFETIRAWENIILMTIFEKYGVEVDPLGVVKGADDVALEIEMREATDRLESNEWSQSFGFKEMYWKEAEERFLAKFHELMDDRRLIATGS